MPGQEIQIRGGWLGHLLRRLIHISMIFVPYLYYRHGVSVSNFFHLSPQDLLWILVALIILLELVRLSLGIQVFGQRKHEAKQISSFAWGSISLLLVLLWAPKALAYPIVVSWALGDPLIGEMRRFHFNVWYAVLIAVLFIAGIWSLAGYWFATPWWWVVLMAPLTVAAERIRWKWIDDNATMQLIPLFFILFLKYVWTSGYRL